MKIWNILRHLQLPSLNKRTIHRATRRRLLLEALEDRYVPSATASGVVSGFAFIDHNQNARLDPGETTLAGVAVTLAGKTLQGTPISATATTTTNGGFTFLNVLPGTYQVSTSSVTGILGGPASITGVDASAGIEIVSGVAVKGGHSVSESVGFQGLAPDTISENMFLASSTISAFPDALSGTGAGSGSALANFRANNTPTVKTAIAAVSVLKNASATTLDLAANFSDPDLANSQVSFNTSLGTLHMTLFDAKAPQTVANFYDYVTSGAYSNSLFSRLVAGFVLQGGGVKVTPTATGSSLSSITTLPSLKNEFGTSNTTGTIAMAQGGGIDTATDQFFFNLVNNNSTGTTNLDASSFTVFGAVASTADQNFLLNTLAKVPVQDMTSSPAASSLLTETQHVPLINYTGGAANFPAQAKTSNLFILKSVTIDSRPESLTYSVVSNSNKDLVTAAITNERLKLTYAANKTGSATITVRATDRFGATVDDTFTVTVHPILTLSPTTLPNDTDNVQYNQTLSVSGGNGHNTFSVSSGTLPNGLSLNSSTGVLSGKPTDANTFNFTVSVSDTNGGLGSQAYTVVINPIVVVSPGALPSGTINTAYNQTVTVQGGTGTRTFSVSSGALPNGLTLNSSSGAISGTPTVANTFSFTITATDSVGATGAQSYAVTINPAVTLSPATLSAGTMNTGYSQTVSANGGTGAKTFSVTSGALPDGLSLNTTTGVINGTPTVATTFIFTITATDTLGAKGTQSYSILINQPVTIGTTTLPNPELNVPYDQTVSASGGTGNLTFSVSSGALPNGLALISSTGVIQGTPTVAGPFNFGITATDTLGAHGSQLFSVLVS